MLQASIRNETDEYGMEMLKRSPTVFVCNAFAKYWAPTGPKLFCSSFNIVSVCVRSRYYLNNCNVNKLSHCVHLQCVRQISCSFRAYIVLFKIQHSERLFEIKIINKCSMSTNVVSPYSVAIHWRPELLFHHPCFCILNPVLCMSVYNKDRE